MTDILKEIQELEDLGIIRLFEEDMDINRGERFMGRLLNIRLNKVSARQYNKYYREAALESMLRDVMIS